MGEETHSTPVQGRLVGIGSAKCKVIQKQWAGNYYTIQLLEQEESTFLGRQRKCQLFEEPFNRTFVV